MDALYSVLPRRETSIDDIEFKKGITKVLKKKAIAKIRGEDYKQGKDFEFNKDSADSEGSDKNPSYDGITGSLINEDA